MATAKYTKSQSMIASISDTDASQILPFHFRKMALSYFDSEEYRKVMDKYERKDLQNSFMLISNLLEAAAIENKAKTAIA